MPLAEIVILDDLPMLPWMDVAAEVVMVPDPDGNISWVDVLVLPDGVLLLAVGQVSGSPRAAPVVASQIRGLLRGRLLAGASLAVALTDLDGYATHLPDGVISTLCIAELPASGKSMRYSTAGHPPPALVGRNGVRILATANSEPLGAGHSRTVLTAYVGDDDMVLMSHNGAFSKRPHGWSPAVQAWHRAVADLRRSHAMRRGNALRACDAGVQTLGSASDFQDQLVTLAAHRIALPVQPLHVVRRADARAAEVVDDVLVPWLIDAGVGAVDRIAAQRAIEELVRNAIAHAYPPDSAGQLGLDATITRSGVLAVSVLDQGSWQAPDASASSQGLGTAAALADGFVVEVGSGTTARWSRRLSRPVRVRAAEPVEAADDVDPLTVAVDRDENQVVLSVGGALDESAAETLRTRVLRSSCGGMLPTALDLSAVSRWSGAAIRLLLEATGRNGEHRPEEPAELIAADGSLADQVLGMLGVAHRR